jgi:hypothetical protein
MAISITVKTSTGLTVENAYHKIEALALENKTAINFRIRAYSAPSGFPFFMETMYSCSYDLNGPNPIKQAYQFLKTLPEFSDAVDC